MQCGKADRTISSVSFEKNGHHDVSLYLEDFADIEKVNEEIIWRLWKPTVVTKFVILSILIVTIILISYLDGKLEGLPYERIAKGEGGGGGDGGRGPDPISCTNFKIIYDML